MRGLESLERALEWLRRHDDSLQGQYVARARFTWGELRLAVMSTIGKSDECYRDNRKHLIKLGWIKSLSGNKGFLLTNKDFGGAKIELDSWEKSVEKGVQESNTGRKPDDDSDEGDDSVPECLCHNGDGLNGVCSNCGKF